MPTFPPTARAHVRGLRATACARSLLVVGLVVMATSPLAAQAPDSGTRRLETIRVTTGSRGASPTVPTRSVHVVTRDEIAASPARSVADVLASQLSLDVRGRSAAQADVGMRGGAAGQVLVLVDGVRVSDLQSSHFDLDLAVPLAAVERIEILRGSATALYGPDAVGGVVNIVTQPTTRLATVEARGGSFGARSGTVTIAPTIHRVALHGVWEDERSDGHRAGTDYRIRQGFLGASMPVGSGTLRAEAGHGDRGFGAADFYGTYPSYERTRATTASATYASAPARVWAVEATLAARRHEDDFILFREDPARYRNQHVGRQGSGEVVARFAPDAPAGLAIGASRLDARLTSARLGDRRESRDALFAEGRLGRPTAHVLVLGARGERSSTNGTTFTPSLSAALPVGRLARLRISADQAVRAPTWTERYYVDPANIGDPALEPERFLSGEAGLSLAPAWGMVDLALHARHAKDLIDWTRPAGSPATEPWRTRNVESATFRGAELAVTLPRVLGASWRVHGSALHFESEAARGWEGKYALRPITRDAGARATWSTARTTATLEASVARRAGMSDLQATSAIRVARRWRDLTLTADVTNVANARWHDVVGRPVAGRAASVGARWEAPLR